MHGGGVIDGDPSTRGADGRPPVVALRALGLGDLLCGLPALRALRAAYPMHRLLLAAPAALGPLALASGAVDGLVDVGGLGDAAPLPPSAIAVNLHGRGPQSHRLLARNRPLRMMGFGCGAAGFAGPPWRPGEPEVERWCRMLGWYGIPADPRRRELRVRPDPRHVGAAVVHPGASAASRRWPASRYARVVRALRAAGLPVVVTGGPDEIGLAHRVAGGSGCDGVAVLAGRTGSLELARIVAAARVVVSGDTGVAHLAGAVGAPSVTLYGPVSPHEWGPPPAPRHRVLWAGLRGDPHGEVPHAGLLAIPVEAVLDALSALGLPVLEVVG